MADGSDTRAHFQLVQDTEYTQSGNGRFLAYIIQSWWKMDKSALAGEVGVHCTPTPFHFIYHHVQRCSVRTSWEGSYSTLLLFNLYSICTLWSRSIDFDPTQCGCTSERCRGPSPDVRGGPERCSGQLSPEQQCASELQEIKYIIYHRIEICKLVKVQFISE